jgi:hypothetical protein
LHTPCGRPMVSKLMDTELLRCVFGTIACLDEALKRVLFVMNTSLEIRERPSLPRPSCPSFHGVYLDLALHTSI